MPVNAPLAGDIWLRYQYVRDNGHLDYVVKAKKCEDFFVGLQWDANDLAALTQVRRPALTINKIISTISNVMGEQIFNRSEIAFRPRNNGATGDVADALTKVFMQISDNNQLDWVRSDVFSDGIIGSRGYFDVRLDFNDSMAGEVRIEQLNPKNVLVDPDGEEYDPDKWNDVFVTKWMTPDQIEVMYSKEDAELLRGRQESFWPYGYDSIDRERDRFGSPRGISYNTGPVNFSGVVRNIRVIERQYRKLVRMEHFVDLKSGDCRQIPADWDRERVVQHLSQGGIGVYKKLTPRIRWTTIADSVVLHDEWSPYTHFTVVPYYPYFRRGRTVGLVENLLGPQELLNKVSSQELHVINTTANSGWKLKKNALKNMTVAELEQRGAQTGLVLELDQIEDAEKILPNTVPTGLDRVSYKAEEHIKGISGVSDYAQGFAREDVAAKAVKANQAAGQANLAKVMDNMRRTDFILARAVLDCVQTYYTEERLLNITTDRVAGTTEELVVNQITPEGRIVNDLTLGEYSVVVTSEPQRDSMEDTQFEQAVMLRTEAGVAVPDSVLIKASKLRGKAEILKEIEGDTEAQELQRRSARADVATKEAEAASKSADAQLKVAKSKEALAKAAGGNEAELMQAEAEIALEEEKAVAEFQMEVEKMEREFALKKEELRFELELKKQELQMEMDMKRAESEAQALLTRAQAVQTAKADPNVVGAAAAGGAPAGNDGKAKKPKAGAAKK